MFLIVNVIFMLDSFEVLWINSLLKVFFFKFILVIFGIDVLMKICVDLLLVLFMMFVVISFIMMEFLLKRVRFV